MGHELHLIRFRNGDGTPLHASEVAKVMERLRPYAKHPPTRSGEFAITLPGDGGAFVTVDEAGVVFERPSVETRDLLYALAIEFDLVIVPAGAGYLPTILVREEQRAHVPPELLTGAYVATDGSEVLASTY